ncbi:MAG TPA: hypothetical protein VFP61_07775, partial [Acidimicrobiales bacterium]|nr:hypothetical protein [Acidimicrobiales bacterium]
LAGPRARSPGGSPEVSRLSDEGPERRAEFPQPAEFQAPDPDERVPGEQGGTVPEQHGGVDSGAQAVEGTPVTDTDTGPVLERRPATDGP